MSPDGTNGYGGTALQSYLDRISAQDDELLSLKGSYMRDCKTPRATIKNILGDARETGH